MGDIGFELSTKSAGKVAFSESGGAHSGAIGVDLVQIAADLRSQLTPEECRELARLLVAID